MNDILDEAALLDRVDNDVEFLAEIVEMFIDDGPEMLTEIRRAIEANDSKALAIAAHTYKGMVANFCATPATEAALKLEALGKDSDLSDAAEALSTLEDEAGRLKSALTRLVKDD